MGQTYNPGAVVLTMLMLGLGACQAPEQLAEKTPEPTKPPNQPLSDFAENATPKPAGNQPLQSTKGAPNTSVSQARPEQAPTETSPSILSPATNAPAESTLAQRGVPKHGAPRSDTRPAAPLVSPRAKKEPRAARGRTPLPGQNRFYDKKSPAYAMLQKANQALASLPADREGHVDWVQALDQSLIKPRADVAGRKTMEILSGEIVMTNTKQMPHVVFPHQAHTQWLACSNCHEELFVSKAGANSMNMNDIFRGKYCGVCHDKVAFSTFVCERCHVVPISEAVIQ